MLYAFGEHRLDVKRRELRRADKLVELEPQVFDVLSYLLRHRDHVVAKNELLEALWGGRTVSDSALTTRINAARQAIGDSGARQLLIRTLPRKGFRFIGEVREAPDGAPSPQVEPSLDKPSIAVLPFAHLSGDPTQAHFAEGTIDQIIIMLCRFRWLSVLARSSSFAYQGQVVDPKRVGWELGVRYLLEGSVRKSADRMRITAQLIDAETRTHLWADWCEGTLGNQFELQDQMAAKVAAAVEPTIEAAELRRSMSRPACELGPHELYLRALSGCYAYSARPLLSALDLLTQAIERDPGLGPALAAAAGCRQFLAASGWADGLEANRLEAIELAQRALQADSGDPSVLTEAARVLGYFTEDIDSAVALIERALILNPNHARGWYWNGWIRLFAGDPDLAIDHFRTALRLNPRHRTYMTGIGAAHFFSRRYREAAEALATAFHECPGWPTTQRFLAAAHVHLEEFEKAQSVVNRLRTIAPTLAPAGDSVPNSAFRNEEHSALYIDGLRAAVGA